MRTVFTSFLICAVLIAIAGCCSSCKRKKTAPEEAVAASPYDDSVSTSYTVALPDANGEGMRMTYTFFDIKHADTGSFRMTHIYMRHTGNDDTTVINGTWRLFTNDSGRYIQTYSGRSTKQFFYSGAWNLTTLNTDSMVADTGMIRFRQKKDNDLRNSTVVLEGKIFFNAGRNAFFVDDNGDTLPILKISAFPDLLALNDSVDLSSPEIRCVELLGTIQIRMAMDGKSTARAVIVEKVRRIKK